MLMTKFEIVDAHVIYDLLGGLYQSFRLYIKLRKTTLGTLAEKKADRSIQTTTKISAASEETIISHMSLSSRKTGFSTHLFKSYENHKDKSVPGKNLF